MSTLITTRAAGRADLTDAEACSPARSRPPCAESQPPTEPTDPIAAEPGHDEAGPARPTAAVGARLRIGREDIAWRTVAPGTVEVGFRIHNDGDRESAPTVAEVRSAPFGAHLDWTLLCEVDVPSIQAGGSLALSTLARLENRVGWLPEPTADTEIQRARELASATVGQFGAGVLFVIPGYLTDVLGAALLLPGVRSAVGRWMARRFNQQSWYSRFPGSGEVIRGTVVIEDLRGDEPHERDEPDEGGPQAPPSIGR